MKLDTSTRFEYGGSAQMHVLKIKKARPGAWDSWGTWALL